ncbi:hypothetical protein [Anaerocolumna cellulosilytica]|nr:hypothetical protein [Anaerocolumna cellulosilytica]MBB5197604.1 rhamnogalacturonyl hydrolase YesR [Anaerocolumna cellulosilytica]
MNVRMYLYNYKEEKKLYYHEIDESLLQSWTDKIAGLSPNFWLRAMDGSDDCLRRNLQRSA